jgi:hypothetical protein
VIQELLMVRSRGSVVSSRPVWRAVVFTAFAFAAIAIFSAPARSETVRTIDDQTTAGKIKGFESENLLLEVKPGTPPRKIPLAEIAEVVLRPVVAKTESGRTSANPLNVWGAIFGVAPDASADEDTTTKTTTRRGRVIKTTVTKNGATTTTTITEQPETAPAKATKTAPKGPWNLWSVELNSGDSLTASLNHWANDRIRAGLDGIGGRPLEIPSDRIRAIWSASSELVQKAKNLNPTAEGQDVALVEKDGDVKSVAGVATGIDGGFLKFKFEGQDHGIKLEHLVGLVLSQRELAPEVSLYETFTLVNGDTLSGRIESIRRNTLKLKPLFAGAENSERLEIPLERLATIDVKNGRLKWVGDLHPSAVVEVPYFDRLMPYRVNQSLTGGALAMADGPVLKGIAVHTKCVLTYDIAGQYERFKAKVGFQQPEGKAGRAALRILGDGKVLWQQADLRGDAPESTPVDVDVAKVQSLMLLADFGPTFDVAARVVWGEARLLKAHKPAAPAASSK